MYLQHIACQLQHVASVHHNKNIVMGYWMWEMGLQGLTGVCF